MSKIIRSKRAGGMAQAVEHLPGNHHAQIQSPVASKKKKKEKEKNQESNKQRKEKHSKRKTNANLSE
jgi:hypothetical protein